MAWPNPSARAAVLPVRARQPRLAPVASTGSGMPQPPAGALSARQPGTVGALTALLLLYSSPSAPAAMGVRCVGPPVLIVRGVGDLNRNPQLRSTALLRGRISTHAELARPRLSDRVGELGERCGGSHFRTDVDSEFVVAAAQALQEGAPGGQELCGFDPFGGRIGLSRRLSCA